jgi:hypothetical protein
VQFLVVAVHTKDLPLGPDVCLQDLAKRARGYVGADIAAVCREAALYAMKAYLQERYGTHVRMFVLISTNGRPVLFAAHMSESHLVCELKLLVPKLSWYVLYAACGQQQRETIQNCNISHSSSVGHDAIGHAVTAEDFDRALTGVCPSTQRANGVDVDRKAWDEIGGYDHVKQAWELRIVDISVQYFLVVVNSSFSPKSGSLYRKFALSRNCIVVAVICPQCNVAFPMNFKGTCARAGAEGEHRVAAAAQQNIRAPGPVCLERCPSLRPTWVQQDYSRQGTCNRVPVVIALCIESDA